MARRETGWPYRSPTGDSPQRPSRRPRAVEPPERPPRVLAHERLVVVERAREHVDVALVTDVAEHHGRVALQSAKLRALHRRALEGRAELLLRHRQQLARERPRIAPGERLARRE